MGRNQFLVAAVSAGLLAMNCSPFVFADHNDVWNLQQQASTAAEKNDLNAAEQLLLKSIANGDKYGYHNQPSSIEDLADIYAKQGKFEAAERLYNKTRAVYQVEWTGLNSFNLYFVNNFSRFYLGQSKFAQAAPVLKEAIGLWKKLSESGKPSSDVCMSLSLSCTKESQWYLAHRDIVNATLFAHAGVSFLDTTANPEYYDPLRARAITQLAFCTIASDHPGAAQGSLDKAESLYKKSHYLPDDLELAQIDSGRMRLLQKQNRAAEAKRAEVALYSVWPALTFTPVADQFRELCELCAPQYRQFQYSGAHLKMTQLELANQARTEADRIGNPVLCAEANARTALIYLGERHVDRAKPFCAQALKWLDNVPKSSLQPCSFYMRMADGYRNADYFEEAGMLFAICLQRVKHADVKQTKQCLNIIKQATKFAMNDILHYSHKQALELLEQACELLNTYGDRLDESTMDAWFSLAEKEEQFARLPQARHAYEVLLIAEKDAYGATGPEVKDTVKKLATVLRRMNLMQEAAGLEARYRK